MRSFYFFEYFDKQVSKPDLCLACDVDVLFDPSVARALISVGVITFSFICLIFYILWKPTTKTNKKNNGTKVAPESTLKIQIVENVVDYVTIY